MVKSAFIAILVFIAGTAIAQTWSIESLDVPVGPEQVLDLSAGSTVIFPDNGKSKYFKDGTYTYTPPKSADIEIGNFSIRSGGRICIDTPDGKSQCNLFVRRGEVLLMLTDTGGRFPIRVEVGLKP